MIECDRSRILVHLDTSGTRGRDYRTRWFGTENEFASHSFLASHIKSCPAPLPPLALRPGEACPRVFGQAICLAPRASFLGPLVSPPKRKDG